MLLRDYEGKIEELESKKEELEARVEELDNEKAKNYQLYQNNKKKKLVNRVKEKTKKFQTFIVQKNFDDPTLFNFDTAPAIHQMVARNTPDIYSDIVFISGESKSTKPLSDKELLSQTFSFHLENKTRELEKELSITNEELKVEREEIKSLEEKINHLKEENRKLKDQQNGQLTAQIEVKKTKR
ncbi:16643_t:CDS:2 [Gigaspora rosea]|nr:16643_t:CDS:2 [Gigaspora rosea]